MCAVGLNTNIVKLIKTGGKPLALGFCCWVGIASMSLLMQHVLGIWSDTELCNVIVITTQATDSLSTARQIRERMSSLKSINIFKNRPDRILRLPGLRGSFLFCFLFKTQTEIPFFVLREMHPGWMSPSLQSSRRPSR